MGDKKGRLQSLYVCMDGQSGGQRQCTLAIHHRESNGERGSKNPTIFFSTVLFVRVGTVHTSHSAKKYIIRPCPCPWLHHLHPTIRQFSAQPARPAQPEDEKEVDDWSGRGDTCARTQFLYVGMYYTWPASTILYGYCVILLFCYCAIMLLLSHPAFSTDTIQGQPAIMPCVGHSILTLCHSPLRCLAGVSNPPTLRHCSYSIVPQNYFLFYFPSLTPSIP